MAIKIIRKPTTLFTMECEKCECVFSYGIHDLHKSLTMEYIDCPSCNKELPHYKRKKYTEEQSNDDTQ